MNNSTSWRDEEAQLDYEPETPPSFSPVVDDNSEPEDRLRTPVPGEADDSDPDDGFCEIPAEDAVMAGTKRRRIFQQLPNKDDVAKDVMAALPRKGVRPFFLLRRMMMTKTLWQPLQGGPAVTGGDVEYAGPCCHAVVV